VSAAPPVMKRQDGALCKADRGANIYIAHVRRLDTRSAARRGEARRWRTRIGFQTDRLCGECRHRGVAPTCRPARADAPSLSRAWRTVDPAARPARMHLVDGRPLGRPLGKRQGLGEPTERAFFNPPRGRKLAPRRTRSSRALTLAARALGRGALASRRGRGRRGGGPRGLGGGRLGGPSPAPPTENEDHSREGAHDEQESDR
jgi:hypothetical protein